MSLRCIVCLIYIPAVIARSDSDEAIQFFLDRVVDARDDEELTSRTEFQAFQTGGDVDADLALHAERLKRDGIVGAADQNVAADADTERGAALGTGISAGEIARRQLRDGCENTPSRVIRLEYLSCSRESKLTDRSALAAASVADG